MKWLVLALGILANAAASLLVKKAVTEPRRMPSLADPIGALLNWPFWVGLVLYGATFLIYTAALTKLPLNVAHPILTSGAIAAVALGSAVFFGESLPWSTIAGIALVILGVALISLKTI
ncbi:DMT family transporter [Nocardioides iriomotensis]|uniref:Multidrug transporter n=1 Tax=Nocardioides iriomotensis TaxID=715784 RepID=A0A4Q5IUP1_9ACTN|nr:SMR family transporter [Nocardioides iriomotensis]RYU09650.1 multidrug transporter [Nocardioides iriomotensis]